MATHDVSNWLKLNILIDRACDVLRKLFLKAWKARFENEWCVTKINIDKMLKQKQIHNFDPLQQKALLNGDVNSLDFITLRAILTSRDFIYLTDKEEGNINTLAKIRNKLVHSASKGINDSEFHTDWYTVTAILVDFGESEADLELLKHGSRFDGVEFTIKEECNDAENTLNARRLKVAGNVQFQLENWAESIRFYSQAIVLHGIPSADLATLHCNRSAAFLKQKEFNLAWEDAEKTIELWPEWWKGHYRQGLAYTGMEKYKVAEICFDEAFAREHDLDEIKEARCYVQMKQVEMEGNDSVVSRTANIISRLKGLPVSQGDSDSMTIKDHLLNWQCCHLGHKYQTGSGGFPQDFKVAAMHYKKAADHGSAEGLYSLALLTFEGRGVKRDMQLGIKILEMAAGMKPLINGLENVGVTQSEHALGLFYEHGIGMTKDEMVAENWYTRASGHGSELATIDLGLMYKRKRDVVKVGQCFEMATDKGQGKEMLNLVDHYSDQRERFLHQLDPQLAYTRKKNKYWKQLEKYTKTSSYARELQKAHNHSIAAQLAMDQLVDLEPLPMTLCKKFITELAACAKIDFMVAELREGRHQQVCSLVDYLLTRKTTFHEDTCVCYAALNGLFSEKATLIFLNECVQKYPRNVFFVRMRGLLNCMLESYEDGIRDMTKSICLDPSKYEYLFDRARMMMLYYPSVSAESTIAAYKEFLAVAPGDDRMIPDSYYGMAKMHYEIAHATGKPGECNKDLSATKKYFDLGIEAEGKQLPFFLPYESNMKTQVEHLINTLKVFTEQKQSTSKQQQSGVPAKSKASEDAKSETVKKERVFRPAMSNPIRENMTKIHRIAVAHFSAAIAFCMFHACNAVLLLSILFAVFIFQYLI